MKLEPSHSLLNWSTKLDHSNKHMNLKTYNFSIPMATTVIFMYLSHSSIVPAIFNHKLCSTEHDVTHEDFGVPQTILIQCILLKKTIYLTF